MPKKFFFPIFVFLISFPVLIYLVSYTRFFNDELRDILTSVVNDQTNARLYLGEIHGSVLGSFTIDGAALYYQRDRIISVDTIEISHFPLSLITKTIDLTNVRLVNPHFYLTRYKDGTYNIDRISKAVSKSQGKFDWTILLKSVGISGGEFSLFDSTNLGGRAAPEVLRDSVRQRPFDPSDFRVENLDVSGSAILSGSSLTANIRNVSLSLLRPGFRVDSLRFNLYTSQDGTELSGFRLISDSTSVHADVALIGQNLLDSLNVGHIRQRHFTVNLHARNVGLVDVEKFIDLPLDPVSKCDVSLFASGSLDTLHLKQFLLKTDSSYVPATATFYNVSEPSIGLRVNVDNSGVNMAEVSALLNGLGVPDLSGLNSMQVDGKVEGVPRDLKVAVHLKNAETQVSGDARIHSGAYDGTLDFHGVDLARILPRSNLKTQLTGKATFSFQSNNLTLPDGKIELAVDSSSYDHTTIRKIALQAASLRDSLRVRLDMLTSKGNMNGEGGVNFASGTYSGEIGLAEFDPAPFIHLPTLEGNLTGNLMLVGNGFNPDSLSTQISFLTERASLGDFPLNNSLITAELNTQRENKKLQINSPFLDAQASGDFVPHEFPIQLSKILLVLADRISSRVTGKSDSVYQDVAGIPNLNVDMTVKVKDARLLGKLIGNIELNGDPEAHLKVKSENGRFTMRGSVAADTIAVVQDSLHLDASHISAQFDIKSDNRLSVWDSGVWSANASFEDLDVNQTKLNAKILRVDYSSGDSSGQNSLSISALGRVDTSIEFYVEALARVDADSFDITASTVLGKLYGLSLNSLAPVHLVYYPEVFKISPADFSAGMKDEGNYSDSNVKVEGSYSLQTGANLHFNFKDFGLASLQRLARLDTNTLKVKGRVSGDAEVTDSLGGTVVSVGFSGSNVEYNGEKSKLVSGRVNLDGSFMALSVQLSKELDSARYALMLHGTIPLSANSTKDLNLDLTADSLDISFLTPFLAGVEDFGATISGNMVLGGRYSSPDLTGKVSVSDGRIRLTANEINYRFNGTIAGHGNNLMLSPLYIWNARRGGTMEADGSLVIGNNTIEQFDIGFRGSLLVLNSTIMRSIQGIYGTAVVEAGPEGLKLKGSLSRPLFEGTIIPSGNLTLMPMSSSENIASQGIIYHFPVDTSARSAEENHVTSPTVAQQSASSGSILDSLKYNVKVETKDNVNLRMIFDQATSEELDAVLGGRLALSNLSGAMELTGDVSIMDNSYYDFYGRQFSASGKLHFTGVPLNPILDITAQYQGYHYADTSSTRPQVVVVQLKMTGTFNQPSVDISMTVDNSPFQGDPQTNAISFILFNEFEDQLTSSQKQNAADNLVAQAGAGLGSSLLSGALTSLLSREFSFIRSVEARYNPSSVLSPDVNITTQFGNAVIKVGGQVFSDINNTDVSVDYPLASILGNRLYLQLSRRVSLNNRYYYQRETINMLRLFYQLSF